jgi:hypothetical protein
VTKFRLNDRVRPKPEWKADPNRIPAGIVRRGEIWGSEGALYVGAERRAFAGYVFELDPSDEENLDDDPHAT